VKQVEIAKVFRDFAPRRPGLHSFVTKTESSFLKRGSAKVLG
jgi:hypothetical protein